MDNNYAAGRFRKRINIRCTPQDVYNAWTTQTGLEQWFLRLAEFTSTAGKIRPSDSHVEKGDRYHWLWHGYPDDTFEKREVLEANGKDCFRFKFSGDCTVSVYARTEAGETVCELWQENIPPSDDPGKSLYNLCGEGWTFYLANLKSYLEGGIDLRNKNVALQEVINA